MHVAAPRPQPPHQPAGCPTPASACPQVTAPPPNITNYNDRHACHARLPPRWVFPGRRRCQSACGAPGQETGGSAAASGRVGTLQAWLLLLPLPPLLLLCARKHTERFRAIQATASPAQGTAAHAAPLVATRGTLPSSASTRPGCARHHHELNKQTVPAHHHQSDARRTCPVMATSGTESSRASARPVTRLVAPGPEVAMHTPTWPVTLAKPSAAKISP